MKELILDNEKIIEKFELDYYFNSKDYSVSSALSALETTNEIQKRYFVKEESNDIGENLLNLYALLQSLFVSIDSLPPFKITALEDLIAKAEICEITSGRASKIIPKTPIGHDIFVNINPESKERCIRTLPIGSSSS